MKMGGRDGQIARGVSARRQSPIFIGDADGKWEFDLREEG